MTRSRVKNDFAVGIDDTATATAITIDSSKNVGIGTETPDSKLVVHGVNGSASRIHISSGSAGQQTFTGSGSGLLLTARNMNTTSKFTPAIQFGSKDVDFTTTNPKVGAAINGIASQTYSTDDRGGMDLAFYTTPNTPGTGQTTTERMRILAEGGLTFNGDTATANALDDYEEGTWSPTISSSGTPPTISAYTRQTGRYTKIGNTVRFQLFIEFTCTAIGTGLAYVSLPFNCISGDSYSAVSVAFNNVFTIGSTDHFGAYTESNQDQVYFTSNATLLNIGTTGSGLRLIMGGVYETA